MFDMPEQDEVALEIALKALKVIAEAAYKGHAVTASEVAQEALNQIKDECGELP